MNSSHSCKASNWVRFLRQYGPIPRNDNMYDEAIQRVLKRHKEIPAIRFEPAHLKELVDNFKSVEPYSVILTGTAGDGKTFYCREIWQALLGSLDQWDSSKKVQYTSLGEKTLVVIKDLSELTDEKNECLKKLVDAITGNNKEEVYLIAANDGQLMEALASVNHDIDITPIRKEIENLLVLDKRETQKFKLFLYNLSRLNAAHIFPKVLEAILEHPGWNECSQCPFQESSEGSLRCPIIENKKRLEDKLFQNRLIDLLELCELNGLHVPIRQLLILLANAILGHPDAKDKLMTCEEVPKILKENKASLASVYSNILGENLSARRRESTTIFEVLGRFGIGNESSNRIDNMLIFGEDDPELSNDYKALVGIDPYYGANASYRNLQKAYLEGATPEEQQQFLDLLKIQRQRLFFTIPEEQQKEMHLWQLTVFHYAGEFLNNIYQALKEKKTERISNIVVAKIVRGMNRIFTGLLVNNKDELILATSGSFSQAKICRVFEEFISVQKKRGEYITLELDSDNNKPTLVVSLSANTNMQKAKMLLNLTRYEYLCRVAEGALPNSFSRECYEDILAFKTRLLRQLFARRQEEREEGESENYMVLRLITELDSNGMLHNPYSLEVNI